MTASEFPSEGEARPGDGKLLGLSADRYVPEGVTLPLPRDADDWSTVLVNLQPLQDLVATHLVEPLAADAAALTAERGAGNDGFGGKFGGKAGAVAGAIVAVAIAVLAGGAAARKRQRSGKEPQP